ncbi:hypothetical protein ACRALDRAFT_212319 [Sodiomyces alcalophilus JCM 7366]|uniref:uncharacterized protein n=1 Tax=Sodiomyces alcalophilus JCM 7366 TaxID=591952 RepID=UPI0039B6D453
MGKIDRHSSAAVTASESRRHEEMRAYIRMLLVRHRRITAVKTDGEAEETTDASLLGSCFNQDHSQPSPILVSASSASGVDFRGPSDAPMKRFIAASHKPPTVDLSTAVDFNRPVGLPSAYMENP